MTQLDTFGWSAFASAWTAPPDLFPARVVAQLRGQLDIHSEAGPARALIRGSLLDDPPVVGDWVAVRSIGDQCLIVDRLPRRSVLTRRRVGGGGPQVVAANVDCVAVVSSMDGDFNPRRMERYLAMARGAGCQARVLLTKADRVAEPEAFTDRFGEPCLVVSALREQGLDAVREWVGQGTLALLGSSGVGKSTLINALVGQQVQQTGAVSDYDGRGQHTTTTRNLVRMPQGGCVIDTPGMRELGLSADADPGQVFSDISDLAERCAFADCQHASEPGCAVQEAIAEGALDPGRLRSFDKLQRERAREQRRGDKRLERQAKKQWAKRTRQSSRGRRGRER